MSCCILSNIRYAESSSEENETEGNGEDDDLDAEGKTTNNVYRRKDADDVFLVPESQASKMDVTGDISLPCIILLMQ